MCCFAKLLAILAANLASSALKMRCQQRKIDSQHEMHDCSFFNCRHSLTASLLGMRLQKSLLGVFEKACKAHSSACSLAIWPHLQLELLELSCISFCHSVRCTCQTLALLCVMSKYVTRQRPQPTLSKCSGATNDKTPCPGSGAYRRNLHKFVLMCSI